MVGVDEIARRGLGRCTGHLRSLPILVLSVHSACNCRCVMCDIWKANAEKRQIGLLELEQHIESIRRMRVQRVMLTGGEPLLHTNLWALCDRLRDEGVQVTLVTTGLLVEQHARAIASTIDEIVISIDGPPDVHDAIRRVRGGFERIARGLQALTLQATRPRTIVRTVVQQSNYTALSATVRACQELAVDRLSFLAADVSSSAFHRPEPWSATRRAEVAVSAEQLDALARAILDVETNCAPALEAGFIAGGAAALWRIHEYYGALAGMRDFPRVRCNAPWISAVLEPGGQIRPCFFHDAYPSAGDVPLDETLNSSAARRFRRTLNVKTNETCRRCVCSLSLPLWAEA